MVFSTFHFVTLYLHLFKKVYISGSQHSVYGAAAGEFRAVPRRRRRPRSVAARRRILAWSGGRRLWGEGAEEEGVAAWQNHWYGISIR